jgi:hypothetical protein
MSKRFTNNLVAVAAVVLTFASRANAGTAISDSMTIFDPQGVVVAQAIATEADEIQNGAAFIYSVPGSGALIDPTMFGAYTVLTEGVGGPGSDIFGIASIGGQLSLAFSSDVDGLPWPYPNVGNPFTFPEVAPGLYDATRYLSPGLQATGWTAQFFSDFDRSVPEPSSLALAGFGGLGLVIAAIRKARQAR